MRYSSIGFEKPGLSGHLPGNDCFQSPMGCSTQSRPRVCDLAYVRYVSKAVKRKVVLHTVKPATLTKSVFFSLSTVDPSPKDSENGLWRSCAVELVSGSYCLCPEQLESQLVEGKERSLLPVSKSTVSCRGSVSGFESSCGKVIPAKFTDYVSIEMVPNHN
jgi:hypothetical protein